MYELTQKEHDAVLQLNAEYRRSYFMSKALVQGGFYIIADDDGPFMLEDLDTDEEDEKATVLPVFAHEDFANEFIATAENLKGFKAQFVTNEAFNNSWLEMLNSNEILLGFMPVGGGEFEISAPDPIVVATQA